MARRVGKLNSYKSRMRRCALSGLRGYECDMVHANGRWYLPRWREDGRARGGGGALQTTLYDTSVRMALVLTTIDSIPLGWWDETAVGDSGGGIRVGGD
jgi:hypothetical protein